MSSATTSKTGFDVHYRTIDLVTITTLAVAFGVIFWGWDKAYEPLSGPATVAYPPSAALFGGIWLMAGVVGGLVVRKPGAAFATEFLAAVVSAIVLGGNQWGFSTLASGIWQGLGAEVVFLLLFYRRFGIVAAALAGAAAGAFEAVYEWGSYYSGWDLSYKLVHLGFFALAGAVVAGGGGFLLTKALAKAGVLDAFQAGHEQVSEV